MNDQPLWRRRLWVWLPALLFVLVNLSLFSAYRLVYAGQAEALRKQLTQRESVLNEREAKLHSLGTLVLDARTNRERVASLYNDRLSTERQRFTRIVAEIKDLAGRTGLDPRSISYPGEEIAEYGLTKRYVTFTVEGSYSDLRQFIRELEVTHSFVTLEQVALTEGNTQGALQISLRLSTFFARDRRSGGAAPATGEAAP